MKNFTNEPPENTQELIRRLKIYIDKSYNKSDKQDIQKIISNCDLTIVKTGDWGSRWGYAEAKAIITMPFEFYELTNKTIANHLATLIDSLMQTTEHGLEITSVDFMPGNVKQEDITSELSNIISENQELADNLSIPSDLVEKGKQMSQAYLYIYFVENCLRLFIENVQKNNIINIPRSVNDTINKNKTSEQQNKFLPLRGSSDLYYCDFVQLQQIIIHNWELFKSYFPNQDQHWLRVKIEDMYRVRNLIAHCGYITKEEFEMIKSNFKMILRQLKFTS